MKVEKKRHIQLTDRALSEYRKAYSAQRKTFYRERYSSDKRSSEIVVLMRYDERDGKFKRWHDGLTFEDARRGRFAPATHAVRESLAADVLSEAV